MPIEKGHNWRRPAFAFITCLGVILFALGGAAASGLTALAAGAVRVRVSPKLLFWSFLLLLLRALLRPAPRVLRWARHALLPLSEQDRFVVIAWAASRVGLLALSYYAWTVLPAAHGPSARSFIDLWTLSWDGRWYLAIAAHGYSYLPGHESSVAFYPLWPLLIHAAQLIGSSPQWASFALAQAFLLLGLLGVARLAERQLSPEAARWTVVWMLATPFAFFFTANYTESLFLCLTVWAFLLAARGHRTFAAALGLLASVTRLPGVFLIIGLPLAESDSAKARPGRAIDWFQERAVYLLVLAGPLAYSAFLQFKVGNFRAAFVAQSAWGRGLATGFHDWTKALVTLFHRPGDLRFTLFVFYLPMAIAVALLLRELWRRRLSGYFAFTLLALLPGALLGLESFGRFATPLFALAWPLAELSVRRPQLAALLIALCACAQGLFAALFVLGYWMT